MMRYIQEHCTICGKIQAMPVVQEDECHPGLIWIQCPECREIKPVEGGAVCADEKTSGDKAPAIKKRVVRHYRAGEAFVAGEWIYHPEWKDTGQVKEKFKSTGGREIIVVEFEKMGEKRLVSNFAG